MVNIDEMKFGFVPGRGTTDAIFIVRQLQCSRSTPLLRNYFAFVGLEKAFDHVPRKVPWWQWSIKWRVWRGSWWTSPFCTYPTALHSGTRGAFKWALVHHGSFSMLMIWCSSQTLKRGVSPSSRGGRLASKVKFSMSTRRPSSWFLVMIMMSSMNLASAPVLSAVVMSAETPSCVRSAMLHGSETWGPKEPEMQRLRHNACAMLCWISGIKDRDETPSSSLLLKPGIEDITWILRCQRLRWYGHVQWATSYIKSIKNFLLPSSAKKERKRERKKKKGLVRHRQNVWWLISICVT